MQLELEMPERLVRKLKALNILQGGVSADDIEALVLNMMEISIDSRIRNFLSQDVHGQEPRRAQPKEEIYHRPFTDSSDIADGLGDSDGDEDMPPPETDEMALVPKAGGIHDEDLDADMDVDDPEHEAKGEAEGFPADMASNLIFAQVSGLPMPAESDDEVDHRVRKRRKTLKIKGNILPMTEDNEHSSF